jgi:isopentenyl-diphosphate delta-isomerase
MNPSTHTPATEEVIIVNEADEAMGHECKRCAHRGDGLLHRAFSVYAFDASARLLLQRRSASKPLWPLYWSNSCCSHPRPGEETSAAAQRRLREELGIEISVPPTFLFKFSYHANYRGLGAEHEVCSVYAVRADAVGLVNSDEIESHRFIEADALDIALYRDPDCYTPWLHIAWPRIRAEHWPAIAG